MLKSTSSPKLRFREPTGFLTKHLERLGSKVDKIFPLLDPSLDFNDALQRHKKWYTIGEPGSSTNSGFKKKPTFREVDDVELSSLMHLCVRYPMIMPFIPTQAVLQQLILKASTVQEKSQIEFRLNPKEKKRYINNHDLDEPLDPELMLLRVMPLQIDYPKMQNYPQFYEQTNLMHLCEKYKPDHLKNWFTLKN